MNSPSDTKPTLLDNISLKDMIRRVQQELMKSQRERENEGEPSIFEFEKLVLEVSFVATRTTDLKGGFELKVPLFSGSAGAGKNLQDQNVQKLILTLKARTRTLEKSEGEERPNEHDLGIFPR